MNLQDSLFFANYTELSLHECGREKCKPDKVITNDPKAYHLFHYVLYGSGVFSDDVHTFELKKGDLFYIPPGKSAHYHPNKTDPWIYVWIGFGGSRAEKYLQRMGISEQHPIYRDHKSMELKPLFNDLADKYNHSKVLGIDSLSVFLTILHKMMTSEHDQDFLLTAGQTHVREAKQFIENNFQFQVKVTEIADSLSLNPNYLTNLFRAELGISPKRYLSEYRVYKACQMLSGEDVPIKDVAKRVGYPNPLHFSSEFKKIKGVSPSEYRLHNKL